MMALLDEGGLISNENSLLDEGTLSLILRKAQLLDEGGLTSDETIFWTKVF